ncbi:amidohydrolase family protein [Thiohalospira sp.]|uniref:amidohydrolase family protein n=1 Tax=Thiohalospira sp. TaxID=3080549 RepID=UPI00397FF970
MHPLRISPILLTALLAGCAGVSGDGDEQPAPFADIHTHYNWNQAEVTDADEVTAAFARHNVSLAVVVAEPSSNALEIPDTETTEVVPLFSPYIRPGIRPEWHRDDRVLEEARAGLEAGKYQGIGEVHIGGGSFGPDNRNFRGLMELAAEFDVPVLLHVEASRADYTMEICGDHPDVDFLWAHAGGILGPDEVRRAVAACDNLWVELSARDPWHYGRLADAGPDEDRLRDGWEELIADYPDRFMTGTDPVANAHETYRWHEANRGWAMYDDIMAFHRGWLDQLPADLARRVRLTNAHEFFDVPLPE